MQNLSNARTIRILDRMLDRIAGQVQALNRTPVMLAGSDRIPAMLAGDKFVIREPAGRQLGAWFLDALNRDLQPRPAVRVSASSTKQSTVNNFGGISIHVRGAADVNTIVRDLRFQGLQLRNRRG